MKLRVHYLSFAVCAYFFGLLATSSLAEDADLTEPSAAHELSSEEPAETTTPSEEPQQIQVQESSSSSSDYHKRSTGHNVRLSLAKPLFNLKYYTKLYGESRYFPTFASEWLLKRTDWIDLGLSFRFGYYNSGGFAAAKPKVSNPSESELSQDSDKTSLTLVPLDISCVARFDLASVSYLAFSAWAGYQNMYYQEVRTSQNAAAAENVTDGSDSSSYQVTTGWNGSMVFGGSLDLMISQFEPHNRSSLRSMGFGRVFVSPYLEVVSSLGSLSFLGKAGKTDFSRSSVGLAFLFEGL